MILRTLNDLNMDCDNCEPEDLVVLRTEVIKHIKFFRNIPDGCYGIAAKDVKEGELVELISSIDEKWVKFFFDITEEELK
jgi:hypothetical protein